LRRDPTTEKRRYSVRFLEAYTYVRKYYATTLACRTAPKELYSCHERAAELKITKNRRNPLDNLDLEKLSSRLQ
jgi:hypothetical protein